MDHSLNLKEIQIVNYLKNKRESEVDGDHFDNSLVKIGDFSIKIDMISNLIDNSFIKIDTIPNLLEVETENDLSEEFDKILIKKNSF